MESQPQNPEFRNNPENFHPWCYDYTGLIRPAENIGNEFHNSVNIAELSYLILLAF